jgi:hypothetical protein
LAAIFLKGYQNSYITKKYTPFENSQKKEKNIPYFLAAIF